MAGASCSICPPLSILRIERPPGTLLAMSATRKGEAQLLRTFSVTRDPRLREDIITAMIPMVKSIAAKYARRGEPVDDLIQVGMIGLLKAVDRYDPDRGVPFAGFAVPNISGEIRRHFRDTTWDVRPPRELQEAVLALSKARPVLEGRLGRPPTVSELAGETGMSAEQVVEGLNAGEGYSAASLETPVLEDGSTMRDTLGALDGDYSMVEWRHDLRRAIAALRPRERQIVALRFLGGLSQRDIAEQVGISQMHVSRLLRSALDQMRDAIDAQPVNAQARASRSGIGRTIIR